MNDAFDRYDGDGDISYLSIFEVNQDIISALVREMIPQQYGLSGCSHFTNRYIPNYDVDSCVSYANTFCGIALGSPENTSVTGNHPTYYNPYFHYYPNHTFSVF